jgi:hypothetical protein
MHGTAQSLIVPPPGALIDAPDWNTAMARTGFVLVLLISLAHARAARADDNALPHGASAVDAAPAGSSGARPPLLTPLIGAYVALQAFDLASTYRMDEPARAEANPVVRNALGSPAALIAMKAGSAALTVALTNRISKSHPKGAVLLMVGLNSAYAAIVAHNYAVGR